MSLRKLRLGELVALGGAVCVIVSLALPWYHTPSGSLSAWSTFGPGVAILILASALALALGLATATERSSAIPMAAVVWSTLGGIAAVVAALVRVLERPDHATGLGAGAWLALAGSAAILIGSWQAMRDERTSAYEPLELPRRTPPEG
jgi:hypothetical protein